MVEAAGQLICLFRDRLDYAITPIFRSGAGRIIRSAFASNPSGRSGPVAFSGSMSLYRAGLRLALFLPLGVTSRRHHRRVRLHRCEPRCHFTLTGEGDPS